MNWSRSYRAERFGKILLAFDTIYAEGQRCREMSPSPLTHGNFGANGKPDVGKHRGLPSRDFYRSEIYKTATPGLIRNRDGNSLRLFPSALCQSRNPHLPKKCGKEIKKQTVDQNGGPIDYVPSGASKIRELLAYRSARKERNSTQSCWSRQSAAVTSAQIDGNLYELSEEITLDKNTKHNIEIIVDRLAVKDGIEKETNGFPENVLELAEGLAIVDAQR